MNSRSCDQIRRLLNDLLLGVLDGSEEEALDDHLAGCDACRSQLEELVWQERALAELGTQTDLRLQVHRASVRGGCQGLSTCRGSNACFT